MPIKRCRPTSPGRRTMHIADFSSLSPNAPHRPLVEGLPGKGGRNNMGRITVRHQGGGHKRRYRIIDFKRDKHGVPGKIVSLEYDPNRSARIALIAYADGEKRYVIAAAGMVVGGEIVSGEDAEIRVGNALPLQKIPTGTVLHCVELKPKKGAQLARSAGASVQLLARENGYANLRLRSGEVRKVRWECMATIGEVGNAEHQNISLGKAGRKRWLGVRPTVRGVVMNPVDHPHGGGEGKTSGGRHPVTPWGKGTKGFRTRNNRRTDSLRIRRRS